MAHPWHPDSMNIAQMVAFAEQRGINVPHKVARRATAIDCIEAGLDALTALRLDALPLPLLLALDAAWVAMRGAAWASTPLASESEAVAFVRHLAAVYAVPDIVAVLASIYPSAPASLFQGVVAAAAGGSLSASQRKSRPYFQLLALINVARIQNVEARAGTRPAPRTDGRIVLVAPATAGEGGSPLPPPLLLPCLHLKGTRDCDEGKPSWRAYYVRAAHREFPPTCVFFHMNPADSLVYACNRPAESGAHIKALQRFWIAPACAMCNNDWALERRGRKMWLARSELCCPLPPACLHVFENGDAVVDDAPPYRGHVGGFCVEVAVDDGDAGRGGADNTAYRSEGGGGSSCNESPSPVEPASPASVAMAPARAPERVVPEVGGNDGWWCSC